MYYIPNNLLGCNNAKTVKGEKYGYTTYILYLAPEKQNSLGKNICPHASKGCAAACLYNSGNARFNHIQLGRINKTDYLLLNREAFVEQLYNEINNIVIKHALIQGDKKLSANGKVLRHKNFAIRLNGTSDLPWENIPMKYGKNVFELFPMVTFYDYTKSPKRMNLNIPNYHLTFSRSEDNHEQCVDVLKNGGNVAVVFGGAKLPDTYLGYKVINGDKSDLRFLDEENVIVGLKYKNLTTKGVDNKDMINNNNFIVNI
jgi:hypothetical protein